MRIRIRRGLNIPIAGAPEQRIEDANAVGWVALVAKDYRGLRPQLMLEVGDRRQEQPRRAVHVAGVW
jgi:Na+-transporting NADH:ubiquinone oxidoreductase subunit A